MVVCKCRKATKLYCFVHKVPVCQECICFEEHQSCVIRTYSEWVIDGDYDWPSRCSLCQQTLQNEKNTTRLGCLHVLHTDCLEKLLQSSSSCPACSSLIWPPKDFKDYSLGLPLKLKETMEKIGVGDALLKSDTNLPPFSSSALRTSAAAEEITPASPETAQNGGDRNKGFGNSTSRPYNSELDGLTIEMSAATTSSQLSKKFSNHLHQELYEDDEDADARKYSRRGPFYKHVARQMLPSWPSSNAPILPVTTDHSRRLSAKSSDKRKLLLMLAIM